MTASIRSTCVQDTCIGGTYTMGTWIRCFGVENTCIGGIYARSAFARGVKPRASTESRVTLASLGVKDCCL